MERVWVAARRAAVLSVAFGSVIACGVLTWHAITPGVIGQIGTLHLLALLGLYLAPPAAFLAWRWERAQRAEAPAPEKPREEVETAEAVLRDDRHAHAAHSGEAAARLHHRRRAGVPQA